MKNSDPLAQAKIKAPPPALNTPSADKFFATTDTAPPAVEENPPSLEEEKAEVIVPTTEGQPRPRKLRVVGDEKHPYRVFVSGQMVVLHHGHIIDPSHYVPKHLEIFREAGVRLEEIEAE